MTRTILLLLLAAVPSSLARAQEPPPAPEVLTVDQAVALALQNNPSVRTATLQVSRAAESVGSAKAQRLPTFQVQALAGRTLTPIRMTVPGGAFGDFAATGPIPPGDTVIEAPQATSAHVSATVAQPLSQLYKAGLGVKGNELVRDIDREKLRDTRATVVNNVKHLYYSLLQTESALGSAQDQLKSYRELDRVTSEYLAREAALLSDSLDVKASLAAQEYRVLNLRNSLATQKEQLNDLIGRELTRDFSLAPVPEELADEVDPPAATRRALERRPDLRQARLQVDYADTDRRLKKAEYIPDLSLAFSYVTFAGVQLLPRNIALLGLQLKWEPFDMGRPKQVAEKTLALDQARIGARQAENRVRLDVASAIRKLKEARLQLEASRLSLDSAREKMRVATQKYEQEAALLKDALQAQAALREARAQYDQALLSFWTAQADLEKSLGEDQ